MRILVPHPIIQEMQQIPLVLSDVPYLVMTSTTVIPSYILNTYIEVNKPSVTVFNHTTLGINRTLAM